MSEEQNQEATPVESPAKDELEKLKESISKLEKKNYELIGKLQKKPDLPDDYESLQEFKRKAEQSKLEQEGKYGEAKTALEEQYREKSAADKKRLEEQETRIRELELISPAVSSLAQVVHDPNLVLNNFVPKDKIEVDDGKPVIVDGYERTPVDEWAKTKLQKDAPYLLKQPSPQGGGAPAGKASSKEIPAGIKNPFAAETYNITEQMRLYRTDRELYNRLQSAVKR
tara:strand:+ start:441 stop:1121 length:681 start_codon:yes stop_codon:yes gene_type:complete